MFENSKDNLITRFTNSISGEVVEVKTSDRTAAQLSMKAVFPKEYMEGFNEGEIAVGKDFAPLTRQEMVLIQAFRNMHEVPANVLLWYGDAMDQIKKELDPTHPDYLLYYNNAKIANSISKLL